MSVITVDSCSRKGQAADGWRGLLLLCVALLSVACAAPGGTATPPPTVSPATLTVGVEPWGATVFVDGRDKGQTPLTLSLPAGRYTVRVQRVGYAPVEQEVVLSAGAEKALTQPLVDSLAPSLILDALPDAVVVGQSVRIRATAADNDAVVAMQLTVGDEVASEADGPQLDYVWDTGNAEPGVHHIVVEARDASGNIGQEMRTLTVSIPATAEPSATPLPVAAAGADLMTYETTVTLPSYPYEPHLRQRMDPRHNFEVLWLDRGAYDRSNPQPQPREFKAIVLENRYLRLTFLPELGGRLYACTFKPSGHNIFYANPVLKPSYWGPLPRDENWWLAAGGLEWALPVHEHGYEWGLPWTYHVEHQPEQLSIVLQDSAAGDRLQTQVRVTLPTECACFAIEPSLTNPTSEPQACQFWLNGMLTLGSASVSPNTEFVFPTERMIVHSSGDGTLPGAHQTMAWPVHDGRDLSRYGNWRNWLGVFVPDVQHDYVGAYSHDTGIGVARTFPPHVARGLKLFAFGLDFSARTEYTDGGSEYFELWAGPCKTFWPEDDIVLNAGQTVHWREQWMPFSGIGGLDRANEHVVVYSTLRDQLQVAVASGTAQRLRIDLQLNGEAFHQAWVDAAPEAPVLIDVPLPGEVNLPLLLTVLIHNAQGGMILSYSKVIAS
jgi:hypothetical protein